ncbi:MAG TPA: YhjD/YihY/BrkB family envelope integrity protein [Anaerohalosphaeraceae bacterium]|jgi:membrane protein|nr:YhjD/YihY/BrkB family envelope integrity protein [Anaerohalosphaeraceae bacterium]HRT51606.1 YhjD/YihY/BrkB family envelope integrity protein [Anaerohalosphaeraceae bacterium]HRT87622.1 YhjD/YihY/BrkB family envelope integrity protein [Anaerohalosphaeraceae bacterium]
MLKEFLTAPTEELGRWGQFVSFQLKLWRHCAKLLRQNRAGTQAAALAYHTIFGIVPLAIVLIMVLHAVPAYREAANNVKTFFYEQMNLDRIVVYPADEATGAQEVRLTQKIDEIADQYVSRLNTGAVTLFSSLFVLLAALALLTTIERVFNAVWHVTVGRNFVQRVVNYWALMTLGPLLVAVGFYASTRYLVNSGEGLVALARWLFPYLISVAGFWLLYYVLPNTHVSLGAALWGAIVAASIWTGAKHLFSMYVIYIPQTTIYGVMGLIPLGVFWIWVTWLIVLFGLHLTYATQHLKKLDQAEIAAMRKTEEHFLADQFTVIRILEQVLGHFETHRGPIAPEVVCRRLHLPAEFGAKVFGHLVRQGLLVQASEPEPGYVPATDGANITLAEIVDAVRAATFDQDDKAVGERLAKVIDEQRRTMDKVTLKEIVQLPESPSA